MATTFWSAKDESFMRVQLQGLLPNLKLWLTAVIFASITIIIWNVNAFCGASLHIIYNFYQPFYRHAIAECCVTYPTKYRTARILLTIMNLKNSGKPIIKDVNCAFSKLPFGQDGPKTRADS